MIHINYTNGLRAKILKMANNLTPLSFPSSMKTASSSTIKSSVKYLEKRLIIPWLVKGMKISLG